jgi:hypothetical protein
MKYQVPPHPNPLPQRGEGAKITSSPLVGEDRGGGEKVNFELNRQVKKQTPRAHPVPLSGTRPDIEAHQNPFGVREIPDDFLDRLGKLPHQRGNGQDPVSLGISISIDPGRETLLLLF